MAFVIAYFEALATLTALLLAIVFFRKKRDPRYPPGPPALPIIGNVHQFGNKPQSVLVKWAKQYGPAFSIKMGTEDLVVLNDHTLIKEVFQQTSSSGRTHNPVFAALSGGNYGLIMSEGPHWETQRRFALRKLRDSGFAKSSMEGLILEEVTAMNNWFEQRLDQPLNCTRIFNGAVVNSLWNIMSGETQDWMNSKTRPKMIAYAENMMEDLIDHYLIEKQNTSDPHSSFYKEVGDNNLRATIADLFLAGSETTSHTLSWAMLLLAHNQSVQKKLHEEVDTALGTTRPPSTDDRSSMPYAQATVMEILRRSSISANGVPHRMLQDGVFQGFFLPKNTTVMSNLYYVNNDPNVWGDPENFRPERFLSKDGSKVVKHEALIPFSVGKRQCLGEALAWNTIFCFLVGILQQFHIKPDPNDDSGMALKNLEASSKWLNEPEPFNIVVSKR